MMKHTMITASPAFSDSVIFESLPKCFDGVGIPALAGLHNRLKKLYSFLGGQVAHAVMPRSMPPFR